MSALVLASTSPWRQKMLADAGIQAATAASGVDETPIAGESAEALAMRLARAKAEAVAATHPDVWVLGADQVLALGDEVFGKPKDPADHVERLRALRGRSHDLITGYALIGPGEPAFGRVITRMSVRSDVTDAEIQRYVDTGEGSGCAGGYAAEGLGSFLFDRVDGDWFNVIGLPLFEIQSLLRARGWRFGGWDADAAR